MKRIITGNYRSYKDLVSVIHSYINADMNDILKKIAEDIKETLYDYINKNWYGVNTPNNYQRTHNVLNSITVDKIQTLGNKKEVFIYFDESKIISNQTEAGHWNQHMSLDGSASWGGQSIGHWVVEWMNSGQKSPAYSYGGIKFIENTVEELEKNNKLVKEINNALKAKGYICKLK